MKILFLGHFSNFQDVQQGASAAGDSVQRKIIYSLKDLPNVDLKAVSQRPVQTWPKGRFLLFSSKDSYAIYPFVFNIIVIREFIFSLICFFYILRFRPRNIVQYNSYFFLNIAVFLASLISKSHKILIFQDYRLASFFSLKDRIHDKLSSFFVRFFDTVVPVSKELAVALGLQKDNYVVFPGAMESDEPIAFYGNKTRRGDSGKRTIIFAGALEKYNGIQHLLDFWSNVPKGFRLVIYGDGSLRQYVADRATHFSNVEYFGYADKMIVDEEMKKSEFNVCFRFSQGIDERFFFPSKFFSINCYPGFSLVNEFHGLPKQFSDLGLVLRNDLSNLLDVLEEDPKTLVEITKKRQYYLFENYSWSQLFFRVLANE